MATHADSVRLLIDLNAHKIHPFVRSHLGLGLNQLSTMTQSHLTQNVPPLHICERKPTFAEMQERRKVVPREMVIVSSPPALLTINFSIKGQFPPLLLPQIPIALETLMFMNRYEPIMLYLL